MSTVSVVATVQATNIPPRVRLDVTDTGSPAVNTTVVTRLNPDGSTTPVRTADGLPLQLTASGSNRVGVAYDYEMPFSAAVAYSTMESPTVVSGQVTVPVDKVWLIHPGVPGLSMPITLLAGSLGEETRRVQQGVFYPMGRTNPIIVTDGSRKGPESSLTVGTETLLELSSLLALIGDGGPLLLNIPATIGFGVDTSYIAVSDARVVRRTTIGSDPYRDVTLPFVVVDRPAGGSQAQRTLADLLAYSSLSAIQVAYPSLAAVLTGP